MAYFATEYTIHFDDTMAYGSHHFLTAFKFQCAARESFLFGERIFDAQGVRESLDRIHLITADAYARNLSPARLGDRVAILLTLEDWGRASARFCYRVIADDGRPVSVGFQTLICADPVTNAPIPLPQPLFEAMERLREIEEPSSGESFRDRVLAGGARADALIGVVERETALKYLAQRYPKPEVVAPVSLPEQEIEASDEGLLQDTKSLTQTPPPEAWVFAGQGTFDAALLLDRVRRYRQTNSAADAEFEQAVAIATNRIGGDAGALVSDSVDRVQAAVRATPELLQVGIHLQNVLGGLLRRAEGQVPTVLMGHSFGEIAALEVAGCFDLPTGVRVVCERVRAIGQHLPPEGSLMAVGTSRQVVVEEAAVLGLAHIRVAGRNHPRQTVVSGPQPQLDQLRSRLKDRGVSSIPIAGSTSFHHPQLGAASTAWLTQLRDLAMVPPRIPVYSAIGRRFLKPDDDIAELLASQLLRPFDLQGAVRDVARLGIQHFVDCGSNGILSRILQEACPDGATVVLAATNRKPRTSTVSPSGNSSSPPRAAQTPANQGIAQAPQSSHDRVCTDDVESSSAIAVVAEGCMLPGGATSPAKLFDVLHQQQSGIIDLRDVDRNWARDFYSEELRPDRSTSALMGRVPDHDITLPPGIDRGTFESFSRAQRLLCIALAPCIEALRRSRNPLCIVGATADGFEDHDLAVSLEFAGIPTQDPAVIQRLPELGAAGKAPHQAVQEVFDRLVRPGLNVWLVDAACASSLYATALGMHALETGEADLVVAGGVFCPGPGNSCLFSQFRGLTATGLRPFDADADGVVFSEGAAFVALCHSQHAHRLGLSPKTLIRGTGLSSDGRSSSANVPQTRGQLLALERCYRSYAIDPATITAIEAHGTSTPVGDSTEVETLRQFFDFYATEPIPIHSLKGAIGHAGWAAGTASIIAASEYLRRAQFPAQTGFRRPSRALQEADKTLRVLTEPQSLPDAPSRIAVDGFGFGGANAHLVLETADANDTGLRSEPVDRRSRSSSSDDEIVVVARHELTPDASGRFPRDVSTWLTGRIVLPDLADDMDITQALTSALVAGVVRQLDRAEAAVRPSTSIVLGLSGKTERGIEATARVLYPRLRRMLGDRVEFVKKLDAMETRARPSGAYTLQCMMPNVAAGRAALLANTNGPNFVVDAGPETQAAVLRSASLLLSRGAEGGTQFVVAAVVHANQYENVEDTTHPRERECAVAVGVTTRRFAREWGLKVLGTVNDFHPLVGNSVVPPVDRNAAPTPKKRTADDQLNEFPIHTPVWVDAPADTTSSPDASRNWLVLARDHAPLVRDLVKTLLSRTREFVIAVIGDASDHVVAELGDPRVVAFPSSGVGRESAFATWESLRPDVIVGVDQPATWDAYASLHDAATDNRLCESLFLTAQHFVAGLADGAVEVWGLCQDAWNGAVHPASGPLAGLLKSIQREFPKSRCGVICSRELSTKELIERLLIERRQRRHETEVVYDGERRLVRRLQPVRIRDDASPPLEINEHAVVLATGGARGVTAVLLESLLRNHGCTVVAIGRSPLEERPGELSDRDVERTFYERQLRERPGATVVEMKRDLERSRAKWEAFDTVRRLSTLGGNVEYLVADVTDAAQVAGVMQHIHEKYGRLDLIVHGAGVQYSKRLDKRTLGEFRRTFDVKVQGLWNLAHASRATFGKGTAFHVLSSAYSVFGNDGQHDYGAANETMDRFCELSSRSGQCCSSIAWLAWDGIGMTRGSEYRALAEQRNLSGLGAVEGQRIFNQVLSGKTGVAVNIPLSSAEHQRYEVRTVPTTELPAERIIEVGIDLSAMPELQHHRVRGIPTLPGAWILEKMVYAANLLLPADRVPKVVTVSEITFKRFVRHDEGLDPNMRIVAKSSKQDYPAWVIGDVCHSSGVTLLNDEVFASAAIAFDTDVLPHEGTLPAIERRAANVGARVADPYCRAGRADIQLSGDFDRLEDIEIQPVGRWAVFRGATSCEGSRTIPALLLDAAWRLGAMYAEPNAEHLYVPVRVGRVTMRLDENVFGDSNASFEIRSVAPRVDGSKVYWDRTEVLAPDGSVVMLIEGCQAKRLG